MTSPTVTELTSVHPEPFDSGVGKAAASAQDRLRAAESKGDLAPPTLTPTLTPNTTSTSTLTGMPPPLGSPSFSAGSIASGLLLAALAAVALVLARRRQRVARVVEIIETASLGPRRSLVVARVGDELLLLGSSEGGIALLTTRPASLAAHPLPPRERETSGPREPLLFRERENKGPEPTAATLRERLLARLKPRAARPATAAFESLLSESLEDHELRRKLAAGQSGSVR